MLFLRLIKAIIGTILVFAFASTGFAIVTSVLPAFRTARQLLMTLTELPAIPASWLILGGAAYALWLTLTAISALVAAARTHIRFRSTTHLQ